MNPETDKSNFIDRLPPEVADTICSQLPKESDFWYKLPRGSDIANVRLVSRFWNNVATPRLLPTLHLIFHPDSFERLTAISRHPVISQNVTHLFYEPDALQLWESQHEWDVGVLRTYQLQRDKKDRGYHEYQRLFAAQEQLRKDDYGALIILDALSRLPKLANILMSLGCSHMPATPYLCETFKATLHRPYDDYGHGQPNGVPQLRSLLLGCHQTGRQLTTLIIGNVNWQFLRDEADNMNMMKQSIRHLRVLDLMISIGFDFDEDEFGPEIPECREYLTNNALCDFVKAAPELESLSIAFNREIIHYATELKHIVRDHRWKSLKRVEFDNIDATQADFAGFFSRHASTLRHLGLSDIRLLEQGEWVRTLENVQKTLSLSSASIHKALYCEDPPQYWDLDAAPWEDDDDEHAQGNMASHLQLDRDIRAS